MIFNFVYHSVADSVYEHAVSATVFKEQVSMLQKECNILFASDLSVKKSNQGSSTNSASVMFDDGMRDNYLEAFPIIKKLGIPVTIFVATSLVGKEQTTPNGVRIPMLTWEDMREMVESGLVRIESHTHTHPLLTQLSDAEIEDEIAQSKDLIFTHLGYESRAFAYPKGNFDDRVKGIVCKHFDVAFGTVGVVDAQDRAIDRYAIPRIIVSANVGATKFRAMLHPLYWKLKAVRDSARTLLHSRV